MDFIRCHNCKAKQPLDVDICPSCGTERWDFIKDIIAMLQPGQLSLALISFRRVWWYLPSGIQASLNEIPEISSAYVVPGKCLMILLSIAALVEGVMGDAIYFELEAMSHMPEKSAYAEKRMSKLEGIAWKVKKNIMRELGWDVTALEGFDIIDTLFLFRNNLGHGRTYYIQGIGTLRDGSFHQDGPKTIANKEYEMVYEKLSERGILPALSERPKLSDEFFLSLAVTNFFYQESISFLRCYFDKIKRVSGYPLGNEFESALSVGINSLPIDPSPAV